MKPTRVRRTAEGAREIILDEAEKLLIEHGPEGVKAATIAARIGVAHSNVLHHFGGVAGLRLALVERMLGSLAAQIAAVLADPDPDASAIDAAVTAVFDMLSQKGYAHLIAWIVLSDDLIPPERLVSPLRAFTAIIESKLTPYMNRRSARGAAGKIVRLIATAAVGEGLVGSVLDDVLGKPRSGADIRNAAFAILMAALEPDMAPDALVQRLRQRAGPR